MFTRILAFLPLASLLSAAPFYQQMYGGPGPASATDSIFTNIDGGTNFESFGTEISFVNGSNTRFNALVATNTFQFAVSSVNAPTWSKNVRYTFTQTYSGDATRLLNAIVTNTATGITYTIPQYNVTFGNVRSLIVRMVVPDADATTTGTARATLGSLTFRNWVLNGQSIAGMPQSLVHANADTPNFNDFRLINYFAISGIDFTQAWTLSGEFIMDWSGSSNPANNLNPLPNQNDLAFQIKAFQRDVATPEPATYALIGSALIALAFTRRAQARKALRG